MSFFNDFRKLYDFYVTLMMYNLYTKYFELENSFHCFVNTSIINLSRERGGVSFEKTSCLYHNDHVCLSDWQTYSFKLCGG